ncbi:CPBP family intramembrane glutamic endopeptidase [Chryseobacterium kwangjuense]|uniref:CAAX protease n=1 Tax=Chryseobacterium kwangjuense TaxID=267125 RepID=A0A135W384_9FLAO|nr:CPBP family intramembrane glutamic endopeptidase [Chryseobacterium kwangjuense]KXH79172.1 CAAX protease [Chryseobacterium kwangjuense]
MKQNRFLRIILFFVIATVLSNLFRFDVFSLKENLQTLPEWMYIILITLLEGSGILVGTVIAFCFFYKRKESDATLFGSSPGYSILMMTVPVILFTIIGVSNSINMSSHFYGFFTILCTLVYCIIEEYGWRGYLQGELQDLKPWKKYILIGLIWYIWHLPFLTETNILNNLLFLGGLILGSWGIGQVVISTRSICACACFHLLVQILLYNSLIKNGIDPKQKQIIIGVCIILWILIIKRWERANKNRQPDFKK